MAATREYAAMKQAHRAHVPVPKPISQNRHLVAMGFFQGAELSRINSLPSPTNTFRRVLFALRRLFCDAHIIHGDLSEYNILVAESGQFTFIDWPQSVPTTDPRAQGLLMRDVSNIATFFAKRYGVLVPVQEALDFVRANRRSYTSIQHGKGRSQ
jgi:RIO-like serine/threonine protein kinase